MNPLEWLKNKFSGAAPKGGAIVPVNGGQLRAPTGIQQINTNLKVPGGAVPGGGLGIMGARGMNGGVIDGAMDNIAGELVRGAMVVTGQDTTGFDKFRAGKPVVKNVGGTSFNVATPEGQRGYKKAIEAGQKKSTPTVKEPPRGRVTTEKTNSNGVVQKGTQMTPSTLGDIGNMYDRVLDGTGLKSSRYNPFESVSLPTYGASASDAKVMGASDADAKQIASGGAVETLIDGANITSSPYANAIDQVSTEGGQKIVKSGAQKVVKGANGHEFGGDHEAPATIKRDRTSQLRRKYMLDDNLSSMQALRAMRDAQGFDRHGDGYYAHGSAKPGDTTAATKIDKEQYQQAIRSDAGTASVVQDLKDSYVAAAKDVQSPESTTNDYWNERTTKVEDPSAMSATTRQAYELTAPGASFNKDGPVDDNSEQVARDYLKIKKPFRG